MQRLRCRPHSAQASCLQQMLAAPPSAKAASRPDTVHLASAMRTMPLMQVTARPVASGAACRALCRRTARMERLYLAMSPRRCKHRAMRLRVRKVRYCDHQVLPKLTVAVVCTDHGTDMLATQDMRSACQRWSPQRTPHTTVWHRAMHTEPCTRSHVHLTLGLCRQRGGVAIQ